MTTEKKKSEGDNLGDLSDKMNKLTTDAYVVKDDKNKDDDEKEKSKNAVGGINNK